MKIKLIIGSVVVVLVLSMMFLGPRDELTLSNYLMHCVMPAMVVTVFWINYLWLMPRYAMQGSKRKVVVYNIIIIICCCTFLTYWHNIEFKYSHRNTRQDTKEKKMDRPPFEEHRFGDRLFEGKEQAMRHHPEHKRGVFPGPPPDMRHEKRMNHISILSALRDSINFAFAIFVAYSMRSQQHIGRLRQKRQEAEVARRDAELRSLRNQISPHFLLNTLNNIYALAAIDAERTQGAVMQLSKMLRHMLYDNQTEMVTLRSEADFIRSYIDLMRLRLASNVKVEAEFNIDENANTLVAPLLFISLVENAFKHGVSSTEPCIIKIELTEINGDIICNITNSNHPKQSNDHSGHGVGLSLVQQRLDMVYPNRYTWTKGVGNDGLYHSVIQLRTA
jgi:two-component sensor histidine kinase